MFDELKKYKNCGHFFFNKGDILSVASKEVPGLPGVYYFVRLAKGTIKVVYIGYSGTMKQNGQLKDQLLRKRINNKQDGKKRQEFFDEKIKMEQIDSLDIYWFVTMDDQHTDLPGYVGGLLMQRFFEVYGQLPEWNRDF